MACFGAFLGAGQARKVFMINGSMNFLRIPTAVLCLFGQKHFFKAFFWVLGFGGGGRGSEGGEGGGKEFSSEENGGFLGHGSGLPIVGDFGCICWVVALTGTI